MVLVGEHHQLPYEMVDRVGPGGERGHGGRGEPRAPDAAQSGDQADQFLLEHGVLHEADGTQDATTQLLQAGQPG